MRGDGERAGRRGRTDQELGRPEKIVLTPLFARRNPYQFSSRTDSGMLAAACSVVEDGLPKGEWSKFIWFRGR